jgi:quinol monooxygenase YgiN
MSISVLVAFAGVLVAAVGTGLLGGQCIRNPQISFIAWTVGMFALTVALLAQSIGFAHGFAAWSFRVIQLSALLVAPLMLAWGLVELVARNTAVRFGARLVTAALVVVAGVVLATDPLAAKPFAKTWPAASAHYQVIPHYALILAHLLVAVAAVAVLAVCGTRGHREGAGSAAGPRLSAVGAVAGAALLLVALRFSLPGPAYPGLSLIAAGLVWFGMSTVGDLAPVAAPAATGRARGLDRERGDRERGDRERGDRERGDRPRAGRGAESELGELVAARPPAADDFSEPDFPPVGRAARRGDDDRPVGHRGQRPRYQPSAPGAEPATGMFDASMPGLGDIPRPASAVTAASGPGTDLALPVTPPHGLIAIYTLLEDKVADFDRAADEVAEQVRSSEPDTLVYVIHTVPKAPMQRIFYEVYRDRAAYERHEEQPYVKRFVTARRPYVLATNVIELRLKYAKVSPLPQAEAQAAQAQAQAAAVVPGGSSGESPANLPAVRTGAGGPSRAGRSGSRGNPDRSPVYTPREPSYAPRSPGPRDPGPRPGDSRRGDPRRGDPRPRDPGYPPRDPGARPRDPDSRPRDPGTWPRDPGSRPRDPGYPPRDPGSRPPDPGYPPRDPGYPPRDPGYPPRDPGSRGRGRGPSSRNRDPYQASGEPPAAPRFGRI